MGQSRIVKQMCQKGGGLQVVVSEEGLPKFLIEAKDAIEAGWTDKASDLLNGRAIDQVRKVVHEDPSRTDVMFMVALMFGTIGRVAKAEEWYKKILEQGSDALVLYELGRICRRSGRLSEATQYRRKAVEEDPDNPEFRIALALDLIREGKVQDGVDLLREALESDPSNADTHSKLLFHLHYLPIQDRQQLFEEHKRWGWMHAPATLAKRSHDNDPDPDRRLRVGYICADFRTHSVAYNFEAILAGRNREAEHVYGYGNVAEPDGMTERLKAQFDHYRDIRGLGDQAVVRAIEQDRIDILVSIAGHTGDNRLRVLAYKPAPIQVEYQGINTCGIEQVDYRLTDSLLDPQGSQEFHVEELVHLPGGVHCYTPPESAPPVAPLPAKRKGYVTFGSFNNNMKINSHVVSLWAQVLQANEGSRLLLKFAGGNDGGVRDYYLSQFDRFGIPPERIQMCGRKPPGEHLQLYDEVDIGLDTYPFNGCVTTLEALWMGVPTVTLFGEPYISRMGLSILSRVGLAFFAASKPAEYVAKATSLARKLEALERIRASMRQRMAASTLCDAKAYATTLEAAYRKMWHRWCRGREAGHLSLLACEHSRVTRPENRVASPAHNGAGGDVLRFCLSEHSDLQFTVSKSALPPLLLEAAALANSGRVEQVSRVLSDQVLDVVRSMPDEDPRRTDAAFVLATLLKQTEQTQNAEMWYKEVLKRRPHALVLFELAGICCKTGRLSEAVEYQRRAVDLCPGSPELWTTLAEYLIRTGQTREGIEMLRQAVKTSPDKVSHSKLLWHLHQLPELDETRLFEEHRCWGRIHAPISKAARSHGNDADPSRRLRIGYISPDFRGHSVAYFFESLLDEQDRREVETYGYGNVAFPDQVTERLESKFDHYRNVYRAGDEAVVGMIEQDRIDILVDLAGHTSDNRLGVLAHKPAPIQLSYLGFPDTTGMEQVGYRFTDALADPPGAQDLYTEELVYLPDCFLCYRPPTFTPPVAPLPACEGDCFTFGSFNNSAKISSRILDLWALILKADERFRLLLKFGGGDDDGVKDHYIRQFEQFGVSRDKVRICGRRSVIEHFQMYSRIDVALDTYPYNGTTTTCEAMWMGVPTISLVGRHHASRVGLSLLSRVGLDVFTALTPADYVGKAIAFPREPENLSKIRSSLRSMMLNSPLCNAKAYARNVETAYRKMWRRWCQSQSQGMPVRESGAMVPSSAAESLEDR